MEIGTIIAIIIAAVGIIAVVSWVTVISRGRNVITRAKLIKQQAIDIRSEYIHAKIDGHISDTEMARIGEKAVALLQSVISMVDDLTYIWQQLQNLIVALIRLFRRRH